MRPKGRCPRTGFAAFALAGLCGLGAADEVNVFAAASLTEALSEAAQGFEKATGHRVVFNFGGSNDLARQIKAGAPADLFFAADKAQMDGLEVPRDRGARPLPHFAPRP